MKIDEASPLLHQVVKYLSGFHGNKSIYDLVKGLKLRFELSGVFLFFFYAIIFLKHFKVSMQMKRVRN